MRRFAVLLSCLAVLCMLAAVPALADGPDGKALYAKCTSCHLADGSGNAKLAKMMGIPAEKLNLLSDGAKKQTDAQLAKSVKDGKGKMKPFAGRLSDAEINAVIAYVRTLQAAKK